MNLTLAVVGAVFVGVAIIGGGFRIGTLKISSLTRSRVALLATFGVVILIFGCYLEWTSTATVSRELPTNTVTVPNPSPIGK
jgi:hypothetical protein